MILRANQLQTGPHWCRLTPEAVWFFIDIQTTDMLGYGLANAQFQRIHKPLDPAEQLAMREAISSAADGQPAAEDTGRMLLGLVEGDTPNYPAVTDMQCLLRSQFDQSMNLLNAHADDLELICRHFNGEIHLSTEQRELVIRVWPTAKPARNRAAESARELLPHWQIDEPPGQQYEHIMLSTRKDRYKLNVVIYTGPAEVLAEGEAGESA